MSLLFKQALITYLQGTKEDRTYKLLGVLELLIEEFNNTHKDRPITIVNRLPQNNE